MIIAVGIIVASLGFIGASFDPAAKAKISEVSVNLDRKICDALKNCGGVK